MLRKCLIAAFTLLLALPAQAGFLDNLGEMLEDEESKQRLGEVLKKVHEAFGEVSVEQERAIGQEAVAVLLGAVPLVNHDASQRYVNQVGQWVAAQTERPDLPWKFGILDSPDINAFAAPGGYVFVTRGLMEKMQSEAELAGTLAHETAHVLKKHHLQAVQKGARMDLAVMFTEKNSGVLDSEKAQKLTAGFRQIYARGLDKQDEFDADRMGLVIATRAGYDPYGLPAVLQSLAAMNPNDQSLAFLFKTHPAPGKRLDLLSAFFDRLDPYSNQPQLKDRYQKQLALLKQAR